MMRVKQVFVLSTSLRKDSNSEILAKSFAQGALDAGHQVEQLSLVGKSLAFCHGCMACQSQGRCVIDDDAIALAEKIKAADVLVFATPIYYYEMSGQMKTLLDRCNALYDSDYAFADVYLLASAAENETSAMDGATKGIQGWVDCFPRARLAGVLHGIGLGDAGEAASARNLLSKAYDMGRQV